MENPIKMDDLGKKNYFWKHPQTIFWLWNFQYTSDFDILFLSCLIQEISNPPGAPAADGAAALLPALGTALGALGPLGPLGTGCMGR